MVTAETREKLVEGVLTSDRVGEVKFISFDRLLEEGINQDVLMGGHGDENEREESSKTLFGQQ